ncbi:MAG: hypothetical protein WD401_02800 [Thermomicrobiaceae bacterium]
MATGSEAGDPEESAGGPTGVIDTIGLGFAVLNRRPYLIWVPVLLDLLIWLGGRVVAIAPMSVVRTGLDDERRIYERTDDIELMSMMSAVVPTFLSHPSVDIDAVRVGEQLWSFDGFDGLVLALMAFGVAIITATLHLMIVGRLVRDVPVGTRTLLGDCLAAFFHAVSLIPISLAILLFMMTPVLLVAGGLWIVGVEPVTLIVLSALLLGGWLALFFVFAVPAFALGYRNVLPALRSSYQVVQHHTLAVIGLLAIVLVIHLGTPYALSVFTESIWSVPFAIVVHAYVVTGLLASIMLFFQHRDPGSVPIRIGTPPVASS